MSKLNFDSNLVIANQNHLVRDLVANLANLPSEEVAGFLRSIGLTIPKQIRIAVLKNVLADPVAKTIEERANLADELGYRLSWFARYSEYQLESLLKFYNSTSLNRRYLELLWQELLNYMVEKKVDEKDLDKLINLANQFETFDEDILSFNLALKNFFYDEPGEIDGLTQDDFRPVLYRSSTLVELRELGLKYDVNVPRRLKKDQLADIVCSEMADRKELNSELEAKIRAMSIVLMQRFAKDNNIKASIELKKEEIIEYILANAMQTKEMYFLPSDSAVYRQEIEEVAVEPEVIIEEPVEEKPVVEEIVTEEVEVIEVGVEEDYTPILEEITYLRKLLADHVAEVEAAEEEIVEPQPIPTERPEMEPIVLNTASFHSDKKHWKQDYRDFVATNRELDVITKAKESGKPVKTTTDQIFNFFSWTVAIILIVVVVFLLVNYFQGGIF